jgi:hypothetical protein
MMSDAIPEAGSSSDLQTTSPKRIVWGRWWIRILLLLVHLGILFGYFSLTPEGYHKLLGADTGWVIFIGTILLWILLYSARTRGRIMLFCGLVLSQAAYTTLFISHYRAENKILLEVDAEGKILKQEYQRKMENFHLERIYEMLSPGAEFVPEELPGLLQRSKEARLMFRQILAQHQNYLNEAEKRIAAISKRAAEDFRSGIKKASAEEEQKNKLVEEYYAAIESLISFLIERQGHYQFVGSNLEFDHGKDMSAYRQVMEKISSLQEQFKEDLKKIQSFQQE